jgi:hypothetical protein
VYICAHIYIYIYTHTCILSHLIDLGSILGIKNNVAKKGNMGWGYKSVVECLPSVYKVLIQSPAPKKKIGSVFEALT